MAYRQNYHETRNRWAFLCFIILWTVRMEEIKDNAEIWYVYVVKCAFKSVLGRQYLNVKILFQGLRLPHHHWYRDLYGAALTYKSPIVTFLIQCIYHKYKIHLSCLSSSNWHIIIAYRTFTWSSRTLWGNISTPLYMNIIYCAVCGHLKRVVL